MDQLDIQGFYQTVTIYRIVCRNGQEVVLQFDQHLNKKLT